MTVTRVPKDSDRAAKDVTNYPSLHATDLEAGTPVHHVPAGTTLGDTLTWDGTKWTSAAPTGGSGTDATAIHTDVSAEISALTEKTTLANDDLFVIEDSSDGFAKKKVKKSNVGGGGAGDMTKAVYDTNNDGIVDEAALADDLNIGSKASKTALIATDDFIFERSGTRYRIAANYIDPYGLHHRSSGSHVDDDEFDTNTISNYSLVLPAGSCVWSQANHTVSAQFNSQGTGDAACMIKPITLADGEWLETCMRILTPSNQNYTFSGLILTNGTSTSSSALTAGLFQQNVAGLITARMDWGTTTNLSSSNLSFSFSALGSGLYRLKLKRNSSTSYTWQLASETGNPFYNWGVSTVNPGFTPTYGGLWVSTWAGTFSATVSFDYFRHMAP